VTVTSVLTSIQSRATQASLLRRYIQSTVSPIASSSQKGPTKTAQAFAEACRLFIGKLDTWLSELELAFVRGTADTAASTPLSLQRQLDEKYGVMLDCLSSLLPYASEPNDLLNALYSMINTTPRHRSALAQIFVATATPIWAMLGEWLVRGMPIPRSLIDLDTVSDLERKLDPEFWIHRDQDVSWADEDFWEAAFLLREEKPAWIDDQVMDSVLEAGKARGLLRGLLGRDMEDSSEGWRSLADLVEGEEMEHFNLLEIVSEHLQPICQLTTFHLRRTLDEDCGLQEHLEAIDGLFYLKGFSTLQPWIEWLFSQVCSSPMP
jgi:gamma-tubulin complex component 5